MSSPVEVPEVEHTSTVRMTKTQANKLSVGDRVGVTIRGTVKGVRESYDDKDMYDVELKSSAVSSIASDNSADKSIKKLAGE